MIELLELTLRYFSTYVVAIAAVSAWHLTAWTLLFCIMLAAMAWLTRRMRAAPSWTHLASLCALLAVGMNVSCQAMAGAVPAVRSLRYDGELLALDRWLLRKTPAVHLASLATP